MMTETELQQRADQLVDREVNCCLSYLVATLSTGYLETHAGTPDLRNLCEQAYELASPIDDYEEAAIQAGWVYDQPTDEWRLGTAKVYFGPAEDLCEEADLSPVEREVFEHWSISIWLADKLILKGEKVDKDFAGLCVWARTTTGQAISMDRVIREIVQELHHN